jgi:hypothetical protein
LTEGRTGPTASMDAMEDRVLLLQIEPRFVFRPTDNLVTVSTKLSRRVWQKFSDVSTGSTSLNSARLRRVTSRKTFLTFWHRSFTFNQINYQLDATIFQFIILTFVYSSTCFGRFPAHHQELNDCSGGLWFYFRIVVTVVLCSWSGRPDHEHSTTITTIRR